MTIQEYFLKLANTSLVDFVKEALVLNEDIVIFLNQMQLFNDSEKADGESLREYASPSYALWKNSRNKGPGYGNPDLYDTGSFYRGFTLKVSGWEFEIDSTDSKSSDLKSKYGNTIFGLNQQHLSELGKEYLQGQIIELIYLKLSS